MRGEAYAISIMASHSFERIDLATLGSERMYGFRGWDHCVARQILPLLVLHGHIDATEEERAIDWQRQTDASVYWMTTNQHSAYIDTAVAWYEQPGGVPDVSSIKCHPFDETQLRQAAILESYVRNSAEQKLAQWSLRSNQIA